MRETGDAFGLIPCLPGVYEFLADLSRIDTILKLTPRFDPVFDIKDSINGAAREKGDAYHSGVPDPTHVLWSQIIFFVFV